MAARFDRTRRGGPRKNFSWENHPEIEVGRGGDRLQLYTEYEGLYRVMLDEVERAERYVFIEGGFIWQADEVGRLFDGLANLGQLESLKRFPEEIHTLRFRPFPGAP